MLPPPLGAPSRAVLCRLQSTSLRPSRLCAQAYCTSGRWKEADGVLPEMRERGVPPSDYVYRALIFANGRHQRAGARRRRRHDPCPARAA